MTERPAPDRKPRLEIYVDGTNFRIAQLEMNYRDIDIPRLARQLGRGHVLVKMRYYTSPLPNFRSPAYAGQQRFFHALEQARSVELIKGRNEPRSESHRCNACGHNNTVHYHVEKETDVNLAVDMVVGAHVGRFDVAMLVAGDTDYVRAVEAVQATGKTVTWCHFPHQKHVDRLRQTCDSEFLLSEKFLRTCRAVV
jgi:uncharacterized LabA/DUF88 family protein